MSFTYPEHFRITRGLALAQALPGELVSAPFEDGGAFICNAPIIGRKIAKPRRRTKMLMIASAGLGWEHVSVTIKLVGNPRRIGRCPVHEEMCFAKDLFWSEDELVAHFYPPRAEHVSLHPWCLHLWRPSEGWGEWDGKAPDGILVSPPGADNQEVSTYG